MKTFLIFTTGRTGSDYLNSCLDNVKNVMTFSGYFVYYEFFRIKMNIYQQKIIR